MDNIIVNSALWYAEQSSQFLANSGTNKLLDKGYDYYVSILCEVEVMPLPVKDTVIGLDVGIKSFAVDSKTPDSADIPPAIGCKFAWQVQLPLHLYNSLVGRYMSSCSLTVVKKYCRR